MGFLECPHGPNYPHWSGTVEEAELVAHYFDGALVVEHRCPKCGSKFGVMTIAQAGGVPILTARRVQKAAKRITKGHWNKQRR